MVLTQYGNMLFVYAYAAMRSCILLVGTDLAGQGGLAYLIYFSAAPGADTGS